MAQEAEKQCIERSSLIYQIESYKDMISSLLPFLILRPYAVSFHFYNDGFEWGDICRSDSSDILSIAIFYDMSGNRVNIQLNFSDEGIDMIQINGVSFLLEWNPFNPQLISIEKLIEVLDILKGFTSLLAEKTGLRREAAKVVLKWRQEIADILVAKRLVFAKYALSEPCPVAGDFYFIVFREIDRLMDRIYCIFDLNFPDNKDLSFMDRLSLIYKKILEGTVINSVFGIYDRRVSAVTDVLSMPVSV